MVVLQINLSRENEAGNYGIRVIIVEKCACSASFISGIRSCVLQFAEL
jgi:hypothetical protein